MRNSNNERQERHSELVQIAKALLDKLDDNQFVDNLHLMGIDDKSKELMKSNEALLIDELKGCTSNEIDEIRVELNIGWFSYN